MKYLISCLLLVGLYSCAGYRTTQFTSNSVCIGMNKESVVKKFGKPFKTDTYTEDKKNIEILYYKEIVDVSSYTYVLTSILLFENSILTKITQEEEYIPDISIKTQSP
ncbi:hypothetical protein [Gaoshiqia sp. Z1-71]|uniref:hypothetical protein n=1 Tax=Gaoshiqia hydrogeniformans TaxID=3290090 RepID=UPI003BF817E2